MSRDSFCYRLVPPGVHNWMASRVSLGIHLHLFDAIRSLYPAAGGMPGPTSEILQASTNLGQEGCRHEAAQRLQP